MEYNLKANSETKPVEVAIESESSLKVSIADKDYNVDYTLVSDHQLHLTVNGARLNAFVTGGPDGKSVLINGMAYFVQDADLAERSTKKKGSHLNQATEVTPLTPSVVVSVLVNKGDVVTKGQAVVILSAMKMETTLNAPYNGTVLKVNTSEGAKVAPGDILIDIEQTVDEAGQVENE